VSSVQGNLTLFDGRGLSDSYIPSPITPIPLLLSLINTHCPTTLNMSDDELDREWKPNNRPQSCVYSSQRPVLSELTAHRALARSFSLALDDLFKIDNSVADLDAVIYEK
jgi:hypothetical protein